MSVAPTDRRCSRSPRRNRSVGVFRCVRVALCGDCYCRHPIQITARLLSGREMRISCFRHNPLRLLREKVQTELQRQGLQCRIRLAHGGRLLNGAKTFIEAGFRNGEEVTVVQLPHIKILTTWDRSRERPMDVWSIHFPGTVGVLDPLSGTYAAQLQAHDAPIDFVAVSLDGLSLVTLADTPDVMIAKVHELEAKVCRQSFDFDEDVFSAALSSNGNKVLFQFDQVCRVYDVATGTLDYEFATLSADISHDGSRIAWVNNGETQLQVYESGKLVSQNYWDAEDAHEDLIYSVKFSRDGSMLITSSADDTVKIWMEPSNECKTMSPSTLQCKTTCTVPRAEGGCGVTKAELSPDQCKVLASADNSVHVFDSRTGRLEWTADMKQLCHANFCPDGDILVSSGRMIQIFDSVSGLCGHACALEPLARAHAHTVA